MQDVFEVVAYAIGTFKDRFYTTLLLSLANIQAEKKARSISDLLHLPEMSQFELIILPNLSI